ncbi:MAG: DUF3078 domain-containing protein [Bacteroidales bacterium]|nr:DUF3078 domain-containing protein [Candidatus Physcousia equi]
MLRNFFLLLFMLLASISLSAQRRAKTDSLSLEAKMYADSLLRLVENHAHDDSIEVLKPRSIQMNPYLFPLLAGQTLFNAPLRQSLAIGAPVKTADSLLLASRYMNHLLVKAYMSEPVMFKRTEKQVREEGVFITDIASPLNNRPTIADQIEVTEIEHQDTAGIVAFTHRPNFWTFRGDVSLQFTQSYFSENWYMGGENNYSALSLVTLEANFDNKRKIQWENKLEAQLGFQTAKSDTVHALKVTNNLLRLTSKLGFKATSHWFYTTQMQTHTQIYPNYKTNSDEVTTDFLSPLVLNLSIGMDYKLKKKRFNGSLYIAPLAVNMQYVNRPELYKRYNQQEEGATKWNFGPNVTINFTWDIWDNVQWRSRLYWFTDFHYTNIEWENTFSFNINKYLNCRLFIYPKYLDDKPSHKSSPEGTYWMMKEWLSLGVGYRW